MSELDNIIDDILARYDTYKFDNSDDAKEQIKDLFLELIGEDDRDYSQDNTDHDSKIYLVASSTAANDLRADLRKKVKEL